LLNFKVNFIYRDKLAELFFQVRNAYGYIHNVILGGRLPFGLLTLAKGEQIAIGASGPVLNNPPRADCSELSLFYLPSAIYRLPLYFRIL
jgi:hypothetical protein